MGFYPTNPPTLHEFAAMEAGYQWVNTVTLRPYCSPDQPGTNDRLRIHEHHSMNTHLIVRGQLTLRRTRGLPRVAVLTAETFNVHDKQAPVNPETRYTGKAGPLGCQFVEAHQILSPATARRFQGAGAIVWRYDYEGETEHEWFEREKAEGLTRPFPRLVPIEVLRLLSHGGSDN